jgi:hypothetical protein
MIGQNMKNVTNHKAQQAMSGKQGGFKRKSLLNFRAIKNNYVVKNTHGGHA